MKERKSKFDIMPELTAKKIIESNLPSEFVIERNEDKYGTDLKVFKYSGKDNFKKEFICFIEVEVSNEWVDKYPNYWRSDSYMRKKVESYSSDYKIWMGYNQNSSNTIYIIFNKNMTDCICNHMNELKGNEFKAVRVGNNKDERQNWYLRTYKNNPIVKRGIQESSKFILNYIS